MNCYDRKILYIWWRIWSSLYLHFVLILDEIFSFYFEKYFVKYQEQLMNILQTVQKKLEMTQNSGNFLSWTEDTKYVVVASTRVTNLELSKSCASVCYYRACRDDSMCCKCFWCLHHDCCNHGVNVSTIAVAIMAQMSPLLLLQSWCKCLQRNCCNHGANVSTVVVVLSQIFGFSLISP